MNLLINHCWCSKSNWNGLYYHCRVIVSIDMIAENKQYHDPDSREPDWNLIEEVPYNNGKEILFCKHSTRRLKPEVMQWLQDNIKDRKLTKSEIEHGDVVKGWAVGNDEYNSNDSISFSLFFQSSKDAMKFIKTWSTHKNVVNYLNYFKDIRRKLNFKTGRLNRIARFLERK